MHSLEDDIMTIKFGVSSSKDAFLYYMFEMNTIAFVLLINDYPIYVLLLFYSYFTHTYIYIIYNIYIYISFVCVCVFGSLKNS